MSEDDLTFREDEDEDDDVLRKFVQQHADAAAVDRTVIGYGLPVGCSFAAPPSAEAPAEGGAEEEKVDDFGKDTLLRRDRCSAIHHVGGTRVVVVAKLARKSENEARSRSLR